MRSRRSPRTSSQSESTERAQGFGCTTWILVGIGLLLGIVILAALFAPGGSVGSELPTSIPTSTVLIQQVPEPTASQDPVEWVVTFEHLFGDETLRPGAHEYLLQSSCLSFPNASGSWMVRFELSEDSSIYSGHIYLRTLGISVSPYHDEFLQSAHPDQPLAAAFSVILPSRQLAEAASLDCTVTVSLDGGRPQGLIPREPFRR